MLYLRLSAGEGLMKEFNLLLGAGFSKALAGISTGQELSREIFDEFSNSEDEQEKSLVNFNYEVYIRTGTGDHSLFAGAPPIYDFWKDEIVFAHLKMSEALAHIKNSRFMDYKKGELTNLLTERFISNFNYEAAAKHLTNIIESAEIFGINPEKVESLSSILKKIKEKVFKKTTKDPISWCKQALDDFIFFLNYLLDQGYTINIFDLNHDQLIREIIKQGNLGSVYQDFFNRDEVINIYKSDLKAYEFDVDKGLPKRRINHYKLHGDFQIIWAFDEKRERSGWALLSEFSAANKYTWSREEITNPGSLLSDSLLFEGEAKANSIFSSYYHSFAFTNFFKSIQSNEPLMIIGYGGGDSHINSVLENRCDCRKSSRNGDKVLFSCNEFTETILKQVFINLQGDYDPNLFYSRAGFEQGFLPAFLRLSKQWYS
jgi:hypothetical protein